jgi:hypothetical protein
MTIPRESMFNICSFPGSALSQAGTKNHIDIFYVSLKYTKLVQLSHSTTLVQLVQQLTRYIITSEPAPGF